MNQHNLGWYEKKRPARLQRELHKITVLNIDIEQSQNNNKAQTKGKMARAMGERKERAVVPHSRKLKEKLNVQGGGGRRW